MPEEVPLMRSALSNAVPATATNGKTSGPAAGRDATRCPLLVGSGTSA